MRTFVRPCVRACVCQCVGFVRACVRSRMQAIDARERMKNGTKLKQGQRVERETESLCGNKK